VKRFLIKTKPIINYLAESFLSVVKAGENPEPIRNPRKFCAREESV
jgi:hypothetical protein